MRIAFLTTDNREHWKRYGETLPIIPPSQEPLLDGFSRIPGIEVHVISCARQEMESPAKLGENIYFHSLLVPKLGWGRSLFLGCARAVRHKVRELDADVVHGHGTERDCAVSAVFSGKPNVLTLHGNMRRLARMSSARPLSPLWVSARLEALVLPRTDGVICLSRHTQRLVEANARRTWLLPNAVDRRYFSVRSTIGTGTPELLCISNVNPLKNQCHLIEVADRLVEEHPFRLLFLGNVSPDDYGARFIEMIEARSWCEHHGYIGRDELGSFLARAYLLVHPSLEDNCPMAILEAMAAGVPVIANRIGGIPDLVEEGETGFLCDQGDGNGDLLERSLKRLLASRAERDSLARTAAVRATEKFHPEVIARKCVAIYRETLERHGVKRGH